MNTKTTHKLFAYGTLQDPVVQKELFGAELPFKKDIIGGYEVKVDLELGGIYYPRLAENKAAMVQGRIYELTTEQLQVVEAYETNAYYRTTLETLGKQIVQVYLQGK